MLHVLSCYPCSLPGIHPTVDNWIIHGVTHRQPVNAQVYLLDVVRGCYLRIIRRKKEVDVLRCPADGENNNYDHHHKHNLEVWGKSLVNIGSFGMQADSRRKPGYRNSHSSHSANSTQLVARALRRKNQLKILLLLTRHELRARRSEDEKVWMDGRKSRGERKK